MTVYNGSVQTNIPNDARRNVITGSKCSRETKICLPFTIHRRTSLRCVCDPFVGITKHGTTCTDAATLTAARHESLPTQYLDFIVVKAKLLPIQKSTKLTERAVISDQDWWQ